MDRTMTLQRTDINVDEFEQFIALPENVDRRFELIDGEIVEMSPTEVHNLVGGNFYSALRAFVLPRKLGRVVYEVRYRIPGDNRNSRIPDISFTVTERLLPVVWKGAATQMPDLAIEIKSPDDRYTDLRRKAAYYLEYGVRLIWLAFPEKRIIEIYRPDADVEILTAEDELKDADIIPGFSVVVADLFEI